MGATDSEMGAPGELLSIFLISGLLLGSCLSEQACVDDACFDQSVHQLKIERSRTDPESGLKYKDRSTDLVATIDMIGVCLPGVNPNVLADTFLSCSNGKVEEVCTMVKRGWLEDKEGKSVVNENALLATFKDLNGGEDAVRECLQIPEVYEYYEIEYYYYDYEDYFDDYLEESASASRQRRAAEGKKKGTEKKKEAGKKKGNKKRRNRKKTGATNKSRGQRRKVDDKKDKEKGKPAKNEAGKKKGNKKRRNRKRTGAKNKGRGQQRKVDDKKARARAKQEQRKEIQAEKKAQREASKESSNAEKKARKEALSKLGLKKMPSKSSMEKLTCVQEKISELLVRCAKNILSKTN